MVHKRCIEHLDIYAVNQSTKANKSTCYIDLQITALVRQIRQPYLTSPWLFFCIRNRIVLKMEVKSPTR